MYAGGAFGRRDQGETGGLRPRPPTRGIRSQGRNSIHIKNIGPVSGPVFGPKLGQTFEDVSICLQVVDKYILFNLTSRASFRANFRAKNYVN